VAENGAVLPAPVDNGTEPTVTPEAITSDIDTSDWDQYQNTLFGYSIMIPPGFENYSESDGEKVELSRTFEYPLNLANEILDQNIKVIPLERYIRYQDQAESTDQYEQMLSRGEYQVYIVNGQKYNKKLQNDAGRPEIYFVANERVYLQIIFVNVGQELIDTFLAHIVL
jgi:hypothetical protein